MAEVFNTPANIAVVNNGADMKITGAATAVDITLPTAATTLVGRDTTDILTNKSITLTAGTTTQSPLTLTSGTNLTNALAGVFEYDGKALYFTHNANNRGVVNAEQFIRLNTAFTLTSQTTAQKLFNSPTNGTVTVAGTTAYHFECYFDLTAMSSTSGSFGFTMGGTATITSNKWWSFANKAALSTAASPQSTVNAGTTTFAANAALATATINTVGWAWIRGMILVNAAGTLIPQVTLGVASAAIVSVNSYFRIWPVGSNTVISVGNWS